MNNVLGKTKVKINLATFSSLPVNMEPGEKVLSDVNLSREIIKAKGNDYTGLWDIMKLLLKVKCCLMTGENHKRLFHKDFSIPLMKKKYETSACGENIGTLFDKSSYRRREV